MTATIDVTPHHPASVPQSWTAVSRFLDVSEPTVMKCRKALGRDEDPLTPELFQEVCRMVKFCEMRNRGGGGTCTRRTYIALRNQGQDVLEARLRQLQII